MFLSLNKKIIISIVAFFILCFSIFGYTLYSLYNSKLQEGQQILHQRNLQYNELLYRCNNLLAQNDKNVVISQNAEFRHKWIEQENWRDRILLHNLYMILGCMTIFAFLIVAMIFFLHHLILKPIRSISSINEIVQYGTYNKRLHLPHRLLHDEFNILEQTYNNMLDNIETQINNIQEQKEFLQHIIDGIPDALRVIDFSGNIVMVNETYRKKVAGSNTDTAASKCYSSLLQRLSPCPRSLVNCPLQCLKKKKNIKFIQQLPHGQKQYLSVNAARIDTQERSLIIETFRDLSEDIKFSHQQKISSLSFLTVSIAHEIKNNLGSMRLIFESLLSAKNQTPQKYLNLLYEQLLECIKIPERLLKLARFSPDNKQTINCSETIAEICALLDYETTAHGIVTKIETQNDIHPIIGNETDFKMIILNLAQNAVKAMPEGGVLTFSLIGHKSFIEIIISDTGIGIAPGHLTHIFEPFYSSNNEHTGLGLSIVKSLLHNFNADIKATSRLGVGTNFKLKFPYKNKK